MRLALSIASFLAPLAASYFIGAALNHEAATLSWPENSMAFILLWGSLLATTIGFMTYDMLPRNETILKGLPKMSRNASC
jgi:hypothetical protein